MSLIGANQLIAITASSGGPTPPTPGANSLYTWGTNTNSQLGISGASNSSPTLVPSSSWTQLSMGNSHVMAIATDGTLWTWGVNANGQLGDGTTITRSTPTKLGTATDWSKIDAGDTFSMAMNSSGALYAWGLNSSGQVGDNSSVNKSSPVQVTGTWTDIAAGGSHAVAVKSGGTIWGWGNAANGQSGIGATMNRSSPTQLMVSTLGTWSKVTASDTHTLATDTSGVLYAWGRSSEGQMGTTVSYVAIYPSGASTFVLRSDNTLWGWGYNPYLGMNTTLGSRSSPTQVFANVGGIRNVTPHKYGVLVTTLDGNIWTSGNNTGYNFEGDNGTWPSASRSSPTQVKSGQGEWYNAWMVNGSTQAVYAAIKNDGTLWMWGSNSIGQFGNNTTISRSSPIQIGSATDWISGYGPGKFILGSAVGTLFYIKSDNSLWCHGGSFLMMAQNSSIFRSNPTQITGTWSRLPEFLLGTGAMYATRTDNTMYYWGSDDSVPVGMQGNNTTVASHRSSPVQVTGGGATNAPGYLWSKPFNTLETGSGGNLGGGFLAWGAETQSGLRYALGNNQGGGPIRSSVPFGAVWGCANTFVMTNGRMYGWGSGLHGVFGTGTTGTTTLLRSSPIQIGTNTTNGNANNRWVKNFSRNPDFVLAHQDDGTLWAWGRNDKGQLGDNTTLARSVPTSVAGGGSWVMASALRSGQYGLEVMYNSSHALKNNGTLWTWGENDYGQLGTNDTLRRSSPTQVVGNNSYVTIGGGGMAGIAVAIDGTLWCWGRNEFGAVGDGTTINKSSPVQIGSRTDWGTWLGAVSTSGYHSYAIDTSGRLWGWGGTDTLGINAYVGDGTTTSRSSPIQIGTQSDWQMVTVGGTFAGGIRLFNDNTLANSGAIWTWGNNSFGQLGIYNTDAKMSPVQAGLTGSNITGTRVIYNLSANSNGFTAGWSYKAQIGSKWGSAQAWTGAAAPYDLVDGPAANTAGTVWRSTPTVITWNPSAGAYALGGLNYCSYPVQVGPEMLPLPARWTPNSRSNLNQSTKVTLTFAGTAGLTPTGDLWTWGTNQAPTSSGFGQGAFIGVPNNTGPATAVVYSFPVQVGTVSGSLPPNDFYSPVKIDTNNWSSIGAGGNSSYGITSGKLYTWGLGTSGQLGLSDAVSRSSPTQVGSATDWANIKAGFDTAVATNTGNVAYNWGNNASYQLGDGSTINKSSPVQIGTTIITADQGKIVGGYIKT